MTRVCVISRAGFLHVEVYIFTLILAFIGLGICSSVKWLIGTWVWWLWPVLVLFSLPAAFFWLLVFPWVLVTDAIAWFKERTDKTGNQSDQSDKSQV